MTRLLIALAALLAATCAQAADYIATPADYQKVIGATPVQAGDKFLLQGAFKGLTIVRRFDGQVTFDMTGATWAWMNLNGAAGIDLVGGKCSPGEGRNCVSIRSTVLADGSKAQPARIHVRKLDCRAGDDPTGRGCVVMRDGFDLTVEGSQFRDTQGALVVLNVDGFLIVGNTFDGMRGDAVDIGCARNGTVAFNTFSSPNVAPPSHPDHVQILTVSPTVCPSGKITVAYNQWGGFAQGLYSQSPATGLYIHHNSCLLSQVNCINVTGDGRVEDNVAFTLPGADYQTRITATGTFIRCRNVTGAYGRWPAAIDPPC